MAQKGKSGPQLSKNLLAMKFMQRGAANASQSDDSDLWGPSGARTGPDVGPMTPEVPPVGRRSFLGHRSQPVAEAPAAASTPSKPASTPSTPASAGSTGSAPLSGGKNDFQGRPLFKRLSAMTPPPANDRPNKARRSES